MIFFPFFSKVNPPEPQFSRRLFAVWLHELSNEVSEPRPNQHGLYFVHEMSNEVLEPRPNQHGLDYVYGDLFEANSSLAHCVSGDFSMSQGIAVDFVHNFEELSHLMNSEAEVGQVVALRHGENFIYNLVTKKTKQGKPTYEILRKVLMIMKKHAERNHIPEISLPKIGCGLGAGTRS